MDFRYYAEYNCVFKLHNFPFDVQVCEMVFKLRTATKNYVELRDGGLKYKGDKNLVEFEVYNISTSAGTPTIIIITLLHVRKNSVEGCLIVEVIEHMMYIGV